MVTGGEGGRQQKGLGGGERVSSLPSRTTDCALWLKVVCGKVCQRRERSARNGHGGGRAASESRVGHKWMNETMAKITPPSPSSPLPIEKGLAEKDGVFGREAHPSRVSANMAATVFNVEDLELEVTKLRAREAQ